MYGPLEELLADEVVVVFPAAPPVFSDGREDLYILLLVLVALVMEAALTPTLLAYLANNASRSAVVEANLPEEVEEADTLLGARLGIVFVTGVAGGFSAGRLPSTATLLDETFAFEFAF